VRGCSRCPRDLFSDSVLANEIFLPRLVIEKLSFFNPPTCAVEKSHAICGIVCGAPREAFSPLFYPFFIWAFGPGKR
jgi:hypothetical protein